jgi:hypothetical protein
MSKMDDEDFPMSKMDDEDFLVVVCPKSINDVRYSGEHYIDKKTNCIVPHGNGTIELTELVGFTGTFRHGRPVDTKGKIQWFNSKYEYNGEIKEFVTEQINVIVAYGHGTLKYNNGKQFIGTFSKGFRTKGVLTWKNGHSYVGSFVDNKFDGFGQLTFANGNRYRGTFRAGVAQGHGELQFLLPLPSLPGEGLVWYVKDVPSIIGNFSKNRFCKGSLKFSDGLTRSVEILSCKKKSIRDLTYEDVKQWSCCLELITKNADMIPCLTSNTSLETCKDSMTLTLVKNAPKEHPASGKNAPKEHPASGKNAPKEHPASGKNAPKEHPASGKLVKKPPAEPPKAAPIGGAVPPNDKRAESEHKQKTNKSVEESDMIRTMREERKREAEAVKLMAQIALPNPDSLHCDVCTKNIDENEKHIRIRCKRGCHVNIHRVCGRYLKSTMICPKQTCGAPIKTERSKPDRFLKEQKGKTAIMTTENHTHLSAEKTVHLSADSNSNSNNSTNFKKLSRKDRRRQMFTKPVVPTVGRPGSKLGTPTTLVHNNNKNNNDNDAKFLQLLPAKSLTKHSSLVVTDAPAVASTRPKNRRTILRLSLKTFNETFSEAPATDSQKIEDDHSPQIEGLPNSRAFI